VNGEYAVLNILKNNAAVTLIVSDRIYLDEVPQLDVMPFIVIEESDIEPFSTKSGASGADHDIINVFPYAATKKELKNLAAAVRAALDDISGTFNGIVVVNVMFRNQSSFSEKINNRKAYAKDQEYQVRVKA